MLGYMVALYFSFLRNFHTKRGMDKEDVLHIYSGILAIKMTKIVPFAATWIVLEIVILSKVSQREKKYLMILFICRIFLK